MAVEGSGYADLGIPSPSERSSQEKESRIKKFFEQNRLVAFLFKNKIVTFVRQHKLLTAFIVVSAVTICSIVALKIEGWKNERELALYIVNEANLPSGEKVQEITFDIDYDQVNMAFCEATAITINGRYYVDNESSISAPPRFAAPFSPYFMEEMEELTVGKTESDGLTQVNHLPSESDSSTWTVALDDVTVHYDTKLSWKAIFCM